MATMPSCFAALEKLFHLPPAQEEVQQCCIETPVCEVSAERLFDADPSSLACFWSESGSAGDCEVGVGAALRFVGLSPTFAPFGAVARRALGGLECRGTSRPARLYGGHAFDVPRPGRENSMSLPAASLLLPRLLYRRAKGGGASVSVTIPPEILSRFGGINELIHLLQASFMEFARTPLPPLVIPPIVASVDQPEQMGWSRMVEAGMTSILRHELKKVVLARSLRLRFSEDCPVAPILAALQARATESTCFAFRERGVTFLGASPERLVRRRGSMVNLDALAGSAPAGSSHEARLLRSEKDRREHAFVTEQLVQRLATIGARLREIPEPQIRRLEHLVHLHTPIHAELGETDYDILSLVEHVHPTPAVGGIPSDRALDFIRANEVVDRGWYAGPFGWCTANGDGDFVAALRSGVFSGSDAVLFAGAGLVTGSAASAEWQETRLKFRTLLDALSSGHAPVEGV